MVGAAETCRLSKGAFPSIHDEMGAAARSHGKAQESLWQTPVCQAARVEPTPRSVRVHCMCYTVVTADEDVSGASERVAQSSGQKLPVSLRETLQSRAIMKACVLQRNRRPYPARFVSYPICNKRQNGAPSCTASGRLVFAIHFRSSSRLKWCLAIIKSYRDCSSLAARISSSPMVMARRLDIDGKRQVCTVSNL